MKFPRKKPTGSDGDDQLIPLINVVFLMLIFFMVIGRIGPAEHFRVTPPTAQAYQPVTAEGVTLLVTRDGSMAVGDAAVTPETLIPVLQNSLEAAAGDNESPEIRIKADAALTTGRLTPILEQLRASGITRVKLLTWPEGR